MTARLIIGDALEVVRSLPDASVDLVLTSPPFLGLRSYLPPDHPDKAKEMGSEPTPGAFIDGLLDLIEAVSPKLAPHGSIAIELGDTYAGSGGAGGDYADGGWREGQERFSGTAAKARRNGDDHVRARVSRRHDRAVVGQPGEHWRGERDGWPLDKSLCLIPELLRIALVYGFNPLTGRETPRWRARNVVRWCRPNPPVGALADKFRPATSDMLVACVGRRRYFDLDAVREAPKNGLDPAEPKKNSRRFMGHPDEERATSRPNCVANAAGAPPLDWWEISTEPYPGSHYATWPTKLLIRPILAMCPERVCTTCGTPSERILGDPEYVRHREDRALPDEGQAIPEGMMPEWQSGGLERGRSGAKADKDRRNDGNVTKVSPTLGWSDCGHGTWRPGLVLDPFAGSGTTLAVATGHGRAAIGIDLDERNADLARQRVGMFLDVEHHQAEENVG